MFDPKAAFKETTKAALEAFGKLPVKERTADALRAELRTASQVTRERLLDDLKEHIEAERSKSAAAPLIATLAAPADPAPDLASADPAPAPDTSTPFQPPKAVFAKPLA